MNNIDIEKVEKISSLVRNAVLILGAIFTAAFFMMGKWNESISVHVDTIYLDGETISISHNSKDSSGPVIGRMGTVSDIAIKNHLDTAVDLIIRIPSIDESSFEKAAIWPIFSLVNVDSRCNLTKEEIQISHNGILSPGEVGTVAIAKFPSECSIYVQVASTQIGKNTRFKNGEVEVFYDGKRAKIQSATRIYGMLGKYLGAIKDHGTAGVFLFVIIPLVLVMMMIASIISLLARKYSSGNKKESEEEKV